MLKRSILLLLFGSMTLFSTAQELPVEQVEEVLRLERYFVFNLGARVNTPYSEYNPVLSPDGQFLLYTSRNDSTTGENIYAEDRQYFEDISLAQEDEGIYEGVGDQDNPLGMFANSVNSQNHEAPVYISKDAQTIIMFKDNDLWFSERTEQDYTEPQRYPKNINFNYYHRHASLTADGQQMFFTSEVLDKATGRFHLDLYKSSKNEDGEWQRPEPLPLPVNSLYNEDSPEVSADGSMLFFSSDRPSGLGGYDVYFVNLLKDSLELVQLREPINSSAQDIYFKLLPDGENAYFSSDRLGGFGGMDLYKVAFYKNEQVEDCDAGQATNGVYLFTEDTLRAGAFLLANTRGSLIDGRKPDFYDWYLNDSIVGKGSELAIQMDQPGTYSLLVVVGALEQERLGYQTICSERQINVMNTDYELADALDLGVPSENQLLTEQALLDLLPMPKGDLIVSNDVGSTYQGVPLQLTLTDNDPSSRATDLVIDALSQPRYGSVMIDNPIKGTVRYFPSKDFVGNDAFSYTVQSGDGLSAQAFVGVRVLVNPYLEESTPTPSNKPGTVMDYAITSAGRLVAVNVLLNDRFNKEADTKLIGLTNPSNGAARIYDAEEGIIVYAPNRSFSGEETFRYDVISDGRPFNGKVKVNVGVMEDPLVAAVNTPMEKTDDEVLANQTTVEAPVERSKQDKMQAQGDEVTLDDVDQSRIDTRNPPDVLLEPIYFDFDKTYIRSDAREVMERNVALLKEHPDAVIKVVSHCDAWGSSAYNQILSARRAKSTVDYLVYKGIAKDRIAASVGFGEDDLVNDCGDGVPCPKAKHQENRRSEFFVIGTMKE